MAARSNPAESLHNYKPSPSNHHHSNIRHRHPRSSFRSAWVISWSPLSTLAWSLFSLLDTVLATRRDTSFWKTYSAANTKKVTDARPPKLLRTAPSMRVRSDLLFRNAYSVLLDDSLSCRGRLQIALTAGISTALSSGLSAFTAQRTCRGTMVLAHARPPRSHFRHRCRSAALITSDTSPRSALRSPATLAHCSRNWSRKATPSN